MVESEVGHKSLSMITDTQMLAQSPAGLSADTPQAVTLYTEEADTCIRDESSNGYRTDDDTAEQCEEEIINETPATMNSVIQPKDCSKSEDSCDDDDANSQSSISSAESDSCFSDTSSTSSDDWERCSNHQDSVNTDADVHVLFSGSELSNHQCSIVLLSILLKHNLTYSCVTDILNLRQIHYLDHCTC